MKTIGMIGGMSWESTQTYYRLVNQYTKQRLGGLNSAKVTLVSVNFDEIEKLQSSGEWDAAGELLANAALSVEKAGADFLLICTNTMHKVAEQVSNSINIPLLHIADATGEKLKFDGVKKVGLLGTAFTMEQSFYKSRIADKYGIEVLVPNGVQRKLVHEIIYNELCQGVISNRSRNDFLTVVSDLHEMGAEAIILGCTEISLLIGQSDTNMPLYDTTSIHAELAVQEALS
ncbi:aspartate/glutamate racemase family protein [Vibrio sp. SCSIO 43135]|uniref:aspartate/glutamate racemase family protein n=1 Tax=Vibrio sp. SCSIO 43135 TaxID=2819096 RepID=UPI002075DFBF|nr:aspartate/glutamate racemase family protein [Vibrio sp. SCSIO 43135]USD42612.1 aspartate/glutamate racemase family protein [Vibrio sp. SCSIO 43135]